MTAEELQKIEYAATSANVPVEQMAAVLPKMMDLIADAGQGSQKAIDALAKLGLAAGDLKDKRPYDIFVQLVEAIRSIPDPVQRASAAMDIFGKGIVKQMNFFDDFAANVEAITNSGRLFKDEDVEAAERLAQAMADMNRAKQTFLANSGSIQFLERWFAHYGALLGGDIGKAREAAGLSNDAFDKAGAFIAYSGIAGGLPLEWILDKVQEAFGGGSFQKLYVPAAPLTPSLTAGPTPAQEAEYRKLTEGVISDAQRQLEAVFGAEDADETLAELAGAVNSLADAQAGGSGPRSVMQGGGDPVFTDAIRRVGGDLGYKYDRRGEDYQRRQAEGVDKLVETMDSISRNGVSLRA